jgi:Na+/melibiose symporter-like transporter
MKTHGLAMMIALWTLFCVGLGYKMCEHAYKTNNAVHAEINEGIERIEQLPPIGDLR